MIQSNKIISYSYYKIIKEKQEPSPSNKGILYIISTPIGNLSDITLRAIDILSSVDCIACEDTRHSKKILHGLASSAKIISYHKFNEKKRIKELIKLLKEGKKIALICNAGTPAISDPGELLIKKAIEEKIQIDYIPGANSILPALILSGFPTNPFVFAGFIPSKKSERAEFLARFKYFSGTIIFFEAPHRLITSLNEIATIFENPNICIAKELTKKHQEIMRGDVNSLIQKLQGSKIKGEYVLIINNNFIKEEKSKLTPAKANLKKEYEKLIKSGISRKEAIKLLAAVFDMPKREIYKKIL